MSRGKKVGHFFIGEQIAEGTFGTVYFCRSLSQNTFNYAAKVIRKETLARWNATCAFEEEMEILKHLPPSSHVIQLIAILQSARHYYLIMELASGGTVLEQLMKQNPLHEGLLRPYTRHLLLGLLALHQAGIVHRDIKLENLLLDTHRILKITDFSFALRLGKGEKGGFSDSGSPHYVAPEILEGGACTPAVDIWSAGVCIFTMATGTVPFSAPSTDRLYRQIKRGAYTPPPQLPPLLRDMLDKMLRCQVKERWRASHLLAHPWLIGEGRETPPRVRVWRQIRGTRELLDDVSRTRRLQAQEIDTSRRLRLRDPWVSPPGSRTSRIPHNLSASRSISRLGTTLSSFTFHLPAQGQCRSNWNVKSEERDGTEEQGWIPIQTLSLVQLVWLFVSVVLPQSLRFIFLTFCVKLFALMMFPFGLALRWIVQQHYKTRYRPNGETRKLIQD